MKIIENLAQSTSKIIANQLDYDEDQREVVAYGAFTLYHTLLTCFLVLTAGYITGSFIPAALLLLTSALLRKFSGGAHLTSPGRCLIAGVVSFTLIGFLIRSAAVYIIPAILYLYIFLCFAVSLFTVIKYCPVDSPNKPIRRPETKKRLRKGAFKVLALFMLGVLGIELFDYFYGFDGHALFSLSVSTGLIFQSFSLLPIGQSLIHKVDYILKHIVKIR